MKDRHSERAPRNARAVSRIALALAGIGGGVESEAEEGTIVEDDAASAVAFERRIRERCERIAVSASFWYRSYSEAGKSMPKRPWWRWMWASMDSRVYWGVEA